jgi:hypothetical protein
MVTVLVGVTLALRPHGGRRVVVAGQAATLPGGTTQRLAAAGLEGRSGAASVWTGKELLVWGGLTLRGSQSVWLGDGAALDPLTNRWRPLPAAPIAPRSDVAAVWTGTEMLIWGGNADGQTPTDGAAFNPSTNRWRAIASSPFEGALRPAAVWTGAEMLVVNSINANPSAAAYDPKADRWRRLPTPPGSLTVPYPQVAWTGTQAVLLLWPNNPFPSGSIIVSPPVGSPPVAAPPLGSQDPSPTLPPGTPPPPPSIPPLPSGLGPDGNMFLAAYSPASDQWSRLPPVALKDGTVPQIVWTGKELLVLQASLPGAALDMDRRIWRTIAPAAGQSLIGGKAVWTGHFVLMWSGGAAGAAYDPGSDVWWSFDAGDLVVRGDAVLAWTDGALVGWGGFKSREDGSGRLADDGMLYRPPSR